MVRWNDGGKGFHYLKQVSGVSTLCGIELGSYDDRRKLTGYQVRYEPAVPQKDKCQDCVKAAGGIPIA